MSDVDQQAVGRMPLSILVGSDSMDLIFFPMGLSRGLCSRSRGEIPGAKVTDCSLFLESRGS